MTAAAVDTGILTALYGHSSHHLCCHHVCSITEMFACICLNTADNMHLNILPAVLNDQAQKWVWRPLHNSKLGLYRTACLLIIFQQDLDIFHAYYCVLLVSTY